MLVFAARTGAAEAQRSRGGADAAAKKIRLAAEAQRSRGERDVEFLILSSNAPDKQ